MSWRPNSPEVRPPRARAACWAAALLANGVAAAAAMAAGQPAAPALPDVSQAGPRAAPCPEGSIALAPGTRLQDAVDKGAPGASFCLKAGRHRAQTISPKSDQRFFGEGGAVLDGTLPLTDFRREGAFWAATAPLLPLSSVGRCLPQSPACKDPEVVWLDDRPLRRVFVEQDLKSGTFLLDGSHRILIADDPEAQRVEMPAAAYAFMANGARNVRVSNLVIERYGNPAQRGVVFDNNDREATGWIVDHNAIRLNSGLGLLTGSGASIRANRVVDNGQLGISASLVDSRIEGNEIARNNTRGFDPAWEGGGLKAALAVGLVIQGNYVHGNHGPGLWCDIECRGTLYAGNLVESNEGPGIFHEISFAAEIRDNTVRLNGAQEATWHWWNANILLAASQDVVVEHNAVTAADGGTGIALIDQGRSRRSGQYYRTVQNVIRQNVVRFTGSQTSFMGAVSDVAAGSPNDGIIESGHNRFEDNVYVLPGGGRLMFGWGKQDVDFDRFRALGQDRGTVTITGAAD